MIGETGRRYDDGWADLKVVTEAGDIIFAAVRRATGLRVGLESSYMTWGGCMSCLHSSSSGHAPGCGRDIWMIYVNSVYDKTDRRTTEESIFISGDDGLDFFTFIGCFVGATSLLRMNLEAACCINHIHSAHSLRRYPSSPTLKKQKDILPAACLPHFP